MLTENETRVITLGHSVDNTPGGGIAGATDAWRTSGASTGHNALNTAARGGTIDPIPNRAINDLYTQLLTLDGNTEAFGTRFDNVLGEEFSGGPDEAAFDSIGIKLIPAIAGWTHEFTTASDNWACAHNLNSKYVEVRAVKSDGTVMIPDIDYAGATDNSIVLHFVHPVTGSAIIRR